MEGGVTPMVSFPFFVVTIISEPFLKHRQPKSFCGSSWLKVISPLLCIASGTYLGVISGKLSKLVWIYFRRSRLVGGSVFIGSVDMYGNLEDMGQG